jgi:hemoglobin/transferrin/lactoferrin receptor protein
VTGWQVGLPAELGQGVSSPGVRGALSPEKALERLLVGTNLGYRKLGNSNIVLEKRAAGGVLNLQQVTISATRNEQDVNSVPNTVSVHDRQTLDRQNVNTIRELVRYEPGVSVGGAGTRAGNAGYNIRGIDGDRILTQVDGVEVPDNFFNGPYAKTRRNYVDPEIVKRVEILRGPASALYGSSAIGGAVSYFTLDPDDIIKPGQDVGARLKTGYSSADESWLTSATVAGRVQDVDGLLHLSQRNGHETEAYDGNNATGLARTGANPEEARTTNVLAKLGWNYGDDNRLGLTYEKYKDDRDVNLKNAVGGPFVGGQGFNLYRDRRGNDTITRERFGLENTFAFDSPVTDRIKTSLNYQIAKTDQSTAEIYQAGRRVLRTPRHALRRKTVGIRCPVGQGIQPRRNRSPSDLRHHAQAAESHRLPRGRSYLPRRRSRLHSHWRAQPNGQRQREEGQRLPRPDHQHLFAVCPGPDCLGQMDLPAQPAL